MILEYIKNKENAKWSINTLLKNNKKKIILNDDNQR